MGGCEAVDEHDSRSNMGTESLCFFRWFVWELKNLKKR